MHVAPTLQQSYAYADLLIRFYAQLPDQYLYALVPPVETIAYHPLNTVQSQQARATSVRTVLGRPLRRMSALATLPRWNAAAHLAAILYGRSRLPKASVSSE